MGAKFILVNCKTKFFAKFMADFYIHCFTIISFRDFLKIKIVNIVYTLCQFHSNL